jgi:hypothetical protein
MSAPDISQNIMKRLVPAGSDDAVTLVLGAGASAPSNLPLWDEFARRVVLASGLLKRSDTAIRLIENQDPSIVLEGARMAVSSEDGWRRILSKALYGALDNRPLPSPLHLAAANRYDSQPRNTSLATLNFDSLLEDALEQSHPGKVVSVIGNRDPADNSTSPVYHLHGVILPDTVDTPIVSYRDYEELIDTPKPWQKQFLEESLQAGTLFITGTSFRDPDIRHWLHVILRDRPALRQHAHVTIVREALSMDRDTFTLLEPALRAQWISIGLNAITLHDFSDAATIVRELNYRSLPGYAAPQERARGIWRTQFSNFHAMQPRYQKILHDQCETLSGLLAAPVLRGTLWIADGKGYLTRFATDGSLLMNPGQFKKVPTGHDSPMIAGEAIGKEEMLLKDVNDRDPRIFPRWKSVLAIPISVSISGYPALTTAVVTFGIDRTAATILKRNPERQQAIDRIADLWSHIIAQQY